MSLQKDIHWITNEIAHVKDLELISIFKKLLKYRSTQLDNDWWDEISIQEKAEIKEGIQEIETGEVVSHEEVMNNPTKWL